MSKKGDLHIKLQRAVKEAHPELSAAVAQEKANDVWRNIKESNKSSNFDDLQSAVNYQIQKFEAIKLKKRSSYALFFSKAASTSSDDQTSMEQTVSVPFGQGTMTKTPKDNQQSDTGNLSQKYATPSQDKIASEVAVLVAQQNALITARDAGLGDGSEAKIKKVKKDIEQKQQFLKRMRNNAEYQKKFRDKRRETMKKLVAAAPEASSSINVQYGPGRPRIENEDSLLEAIVDLVLLKSAADGRRRTEMIRTYRTLNDLHGAILDEGFEISRSGLYLRLLPRNSSTIEGKRHVKTVPVKLCKAQTDEHKTHVDGVFCTSTIRSVESLASMLGPDQTIFLSQDDKAKVPIGLTAANKQAPLMMHLEYRVKLPDHDWVIAPKHKLTPSVYSTMVIKEQGLGSPDAISYSGPTYIAIRSQKHSTSNANTHAEDFNTLLELEVFKQHVKNSVGLVKPVVVVSVDGGPDENPRYPKVILFAIKHFLEHDLDAMFVVTNAPGRSAFNRVERRMAPLSAQLAGLILPSDTYGTHLNGRGVTQDATLEMKNFKAAGEVLSSVWSSLVIDGYEVVAEYKDGNNEPALPSQPDPQWYSVHVRESQYALQIVKCTDPLCCKPMRSNILNILPNRFLPPPCPLQQTSDGLKVPDLKEVKKTNVFLPLFQNLALNIPRPMPPQTDMMPYDMFCPSVAAEISGRICETCGLYFASKKSVDIHSKALHDRVRKTKNTKGRSTRIKGRRGNEVLCLHQDEETGAQDVEWIDVNDIDVGETTETAEFLEGLGDAEIHPAHVWAKNVFTVDDE